jgi:hypothetical protein
MPVEAPVISAILLMVSPKRGQNFVLSPER